jgi:hypothetical protein
MAKQELTVPDRLGVSGPTPANMHNALNPIYLQIDQRLIAPNGMEAMVRNVTNSWATIALLSTVLFGTQSAFGAPYVLRSHASTLVRTVSNANSNGFRSDAALPEKFLLETTGTVTNRPPGADWTFPRQTTATTADVHAKARIAPRVNEAAINLLQKWIDDYKDVEDPTFMQDFEELGRHKVVFREQS